MDNETIEQEVPKEKPKRRSRTKVKALTARGEATLVEWVAGKEPHRGYVPTEEVKDNTVAKDVLQAALPYGVPWGALVDFSPLTPEAFEAKMHGCGIWTIDDLEKAPGSVNQALAALTTTAGHLHKRARRHMED